MEREFLGERKRGVEEDFFRRREMALLERLREDEARRAAREELARTSRITDDALLDQLVAFGITADTLTALALVPLVEIAWVDGQVEATERQAVLAAADEVGLEPASTGHRLVENSISERPPAHLKALWTEYVRSLCATLSAEERQALRGELIQRARSVAEAAGGFMGVGPKVSSREAALLAEFAAVFDE